MEIGTYDWNIEGQIDRPSNIKKMKLGLKLPEVAEHPDS